MTSVFIATPAYQGMVSKEYTQSLVRECMHLQAECIPVTTAILANSIFIEMARNHLVGAFLRSGHSHLMFIDADIGFPQDAICKMVKSGHEVCAGVCPQRTTNTFCAVPNWEEQDGWMGHSRVGAGFLCIHRDAIDYMHRQKFGYATVDGDPYVFRTKIEEGRLVGEDYTFCDDYGKTIWVWPDLEFSHAGKTGNYQTLFQ